jgi:hypothetical protein
MDNFYDVGIASRVQHSEGGAMKFTSRILIGLALGFLLLASINAMAGAAPQAAPERGPHGYFPVQLTIQTNADELDLRLTNMLPGVSYLVMTRTNRPYSAWLPFLSVINLGDTNAASFRINLQTGKAEEGVLLGGRNPGWADHPLMGSARGVPVRMLPQMLFTAGSGEDADGDSLPDLYEDLVTRTDPLSGDTGQTGIEDGYKDLSHDGWNNLQHWYNGSDPLRWSPAPSAANVRFWSGTTTLTWAYNAIVPPQSFTILRKAPSAPANAWNVAATIKPVLDKYQLYEYHETNQEAMRTSIYAVRANYAPPPPSVLPARCDREGIRQTIRQVDCKPGVDGYELTVAKTQPHFHYLMLVREGTNGFWKASGFFTGSANGSLVKLSADWRGMLLTNDGPVLLPKVEYIPILVQPEFICGSGEDADGDGLPDIYEVLATKTDPDKSDTGATGLLDGYKALSGDGWTALEKYRRRADPLGKELPPAGAEIIEPTLESVMQVVQRAKQSDFQYEVTAEIRNLKSSQYQPLQQPLETLFPSPRLEAVATNLAIRIRVQLPERKAPDRHVGGP